MVPIRITDPDDPRIAAYRDIRERDLKGRHGLFVAEGKVVLNVLFAARRFEVESVLLLENRLPGMAPTLAVAPPETPVYVADGDVLDRVAGFHLHRGVLAIGRRRPAAELVDELNSLPPDALVVVLVGISNHDNVGAIFRNAAAFGVDAVLLDQTCCDPLYRKAIRVSVGAALKVPFFVAPSAAGIIEKLAAQGFGMIAMSPAGAADLMDLRPAGPTALFLGTEGEGLSPEILSRIATARIAMAEGFDSLNVAAASAIALHHLARQRRC
ncbi:TrmH family RNA methyltransferase [Arvimicrobium flavum]|uniref:TrmH family RNA methyltransferase n=1 Tax=Arvimicrobium flavum TaxID=3393320 RepID=UPI00237AB398|nr:RNA methyltransferase [Mesorhizobium shangrilense]